MIFDFEFEFGEDEGPFLHTKDSLEEESVQMTLAFGLNVFHDGVKDLDLLRSWQDFGQERLILVETPQEGEYLVDNVRFCIFFNKTT